MPKLDDHPAVIRHRQQPKDSAPADLGGRPAPAPLPGGRGRRRGLRRPRPPRTRRPAGRDPGAVPLDQVPHQHRLPDEPGADPQPRPLGRQPGVPPHRGPDRRGGPRYRRRPRSPGRPGRQPGDGLPDGDGPLPRQDLGRLAQADRRGGGPGPHGHPPQRHPPPVRQLHPPGDHPHRRRGDRAGPPPRLQPVPGVQAVRGGLPGRGDRPRRPLRLLGLLHAQLPGVHGRLRRLGGARSPTARMPWTTAAGSATRRRPRCGRASASGRTTRRRTAWRSARRARTSSGRSWTTARASFREVVNPLQEKRETLYVVPGSDAEAYAAKRFPHKTTKRVGNGLRPTSIQRVPVGPAAPVSAARSAGLDGDLPLHVHRGGAEARRPS